jgi:tape measure domain-containing protein
MADNATRLKIQASVEGIQGFDGLKRSLQGLAQQSAATHQDLFKLNAAYEKLKRGSDGSIAGMKAQIQVLSDLRESVGTGTVLFKRYGTEIEQIKAKLEAAAQIGKVVVSEQERLNTAYARAQKKGSDTIAGINAQISALSNLRNSTEITKEAFRDYGIELGRLQAQLKRVTAVPQIGALGEQQGQGGNTIANLRDQIASLTQLKEQATVGSQAFNAYDASLQKLQARLKAITTTPEPTIFSPRTLAILRQVDGISGFDNLKQSLQGLAQQSVGTDQDLKKLAGAYRQLKQSGDGTIAGMRAQVQVLTQLRESVKAGTADFRAYSTELRQVQARLNAASGATPARAGGAAGAGLIGGLAARVAAPLATVAGAGAITAAGFDAEASQVRLKALTDQFGEYNQAQQAAATIASTLRLSTAEAEGQFATFYGTLRPAGISIRQLEDAMIGFGAAARNSGATAQETAGAIIQLKQALASGVLQGEELRALREQMPLVTQQIAKEMGISIGELKKAGEEGRITTEIMLKALSKLRDTQLGTLQLQFNTAQQAVTDLGNAFKDTSAELFKLFGPTAILGLRSLTDAIRGVGNELKIIENSRAGRSVSATAQALSKIGLPLQQISGLVAGIGTQIASLFANPAVTAALKIIQTAYANETAGGRKLTAAGVPLTFKDDTGNVYDTATGRFLRNEKPALSREAIADAQAAADENRRRGIEAREKEAREKRIKAEQSRAMVLGGLTGGGQADASRGRSSGPHLHAQFGAGVSEAEAIRLIDAALSFGGRTASSFGRSRGYAGHGYPALDVLTPQETRFTLKPGYTGTDLGIQGALGRGMRVSGPGGTFTLGHLAGVTTGKSGQLVNAQQQALNQQAQREQKLAEQRLKDQQDYSAQLREDQASTKATTEELQLQRDLRTAATESDKIRAQYALDYFNTYQSLTKEIEGMVDPMSILQRIQAVDNDMAERYKEGIKEIAAIENERAMQLGSQQWQDQQVTLAATLSDYYSQQSEKLQEQNELAGSLAQTIGQGMQQAFSLAIQGAENLGQSLQELGATVLKDIAQQLIQIAVIAPVIRAISGIGGGGGIAPISPGINALPAGDFSQFFAPAAGSFAAGLPTAGITPFQGGNPFSFAAGGIMTPQGPVPLRTYARGGIATAPQAAIYGEGSMPEAFIPLPDGRRVPVALKQYPGIPGASSAAQFESTDQVVQRLVETARQESTARAAAVAGSSPDGTVRIKVETTRINSVEYVTAEQAEALAQAAATRSTARQQRALQSSPGARRSLGI